MNKNDNKEHFIYFIQNKLFIDQIYIGMTYNLKVRWSQHKRDMNKKDFFLYRSMKKYGVENFEFYMVEKHSNKLEALKAEEFLISYFKELGATLLNTQSGGLKSDGFKGKNHTEQSKLQIGNTLKKKGHPIWERGHTEEAYIKMSESKKSLSDEKILELRNDLYQRIPYSNLLEKFKISKNTLKLVRDGVYAPISSSIGHQEPIPKLSFEDGGFIIMNDLSKEDKNYLLEDMQTGKFTVSELSDKYDISSSYIYNLIDDSTVIKKRNLSKENHPLFGVGHTEAAKQKMSISQLKNTRNINYVNPMQGRTGKLAPAFGRTGDKHPNTKISDKDVITLREEIASKKYTLTFLAQRYGITVSTVSAIKHNKTRKI